jgi:hypothetical protein
MPKTVSVASGAQATRRGLLGGLALAGVVGASLASHGARAAAAKLSPNEIGYQASPKGNARCELCVNWQAPNACKVVAGPISPAGWCGLFVRKT